LTLTSAGAALAASGGDPIDGLRRRRGSGVWGVRTNNEAGGDPVDGITEAQLSANNKSKLSQLDPKLREPLKKMLLANPRLQIGDAKRSSANQESSFRKRYKKAPPGVTQKTSENDRIWNGEVWIHQTGLPLAPPGQSMHEIGLAADLSQSENEWIRANAASFGLRHGGTSPGQTSDEPFHVQPASVPMGRAQYESGAGISSSPTGTSVTAGMAPGPSGTAGSSSGDITRTRIGSTGTGVSGSATSTYLPSSSTFQFAGMSMGEVIGVGSVYATSNLKSASRASGSYPSASAGGDPIDSNSIVRQTTVSAGNSYNITVSPNVNIHTSGNSTSDLRKMAKEVANILEQEIRMTAMRTS
jgi:hypothetical protein